MTDEQLIAAGREAMERRASAQIELGRLALAFTGVGGRAVSPAASFDACVEAAGSAGLLGDLGSPVGFGGGHAGGG